MTIKNVEHLRDRLLDAFEALEGGQMDLELGHTLARAASTIIGSLHVQLEYSKMTGRTPHIEFMEGGEAIDGESTQREPIRRIGSR